MVVVCEVCKVAIAAEVCVAKGRREHRRRKNNGATCFVAHLDDGNQKQSSGSNTK